MTQRTQLDVYGLPAGQAVTIGVASVIALKANHMRIGAVFTNDSDAIIFLAFGKEAIPNSGIRLNAGGGSYEINLTNPNTGAVHAISAAANKNLCIAEFTYARK